MNSHLILSVTSCEQAFVWNTLGEYTPPHRIASRTRMKR